MLALGIARQTDESWRFGQAGTTSCRCVRNNFLLSSGLVCLLRYHYEEVHQKEEEEEEQRYSTILLIG